MKTSFFSLSGILLLTACQQIDLGDYANIPSNDDTYEVNITSKSGVSGVDIPYPLTVYAVNDNDIVVSYIKTSESSATNSLSLSSGEYTLYAVAGTDAGDSDILDENAITAENGYFDAPIMHGKTNISVEEDDVDADISLSYAVAAVDVTLSEIPTDVNTITVTIGKQYQSMPLDKNYTGETSATLTLTKQADGTTWKSSTIYVFPGTTSKTTLTINSTSNSGESSYTVTYGSALVAGKPYHFKGNYKEAERIMSITCNIATEGWDEAIESSFDFGDGANGNQAPAIVGSEFKVAALPNVGDILNNHLLIYVDAETNKGLLLSKKQWSGLSSNVEALQAIAETYTEDDMTGWSLPTPEQAAYIIGAFGTPKETYRQLNNIMKNVSGWNDLPSKSIYFLCDGAEKRYTFYSNDANNAISNATNSSDYYLRLVKPITFKIQQ